MTAPTENEINDSKNLPRTARRDMPSSKKIFSRYFLELSYRKKHHFVYLLTTFLRLNEKMREVLLFRFLSFEKVASFVSEWLISLDLATTNDANLKKNNIPRSPLFADYRGTRSSEGYYQWRSVPATYRR